jgi:predicted transglutaminase-like cysteine proteinase
MPLQLQVRAAARVVAISCLIGLCADAAVAQSTPPFQFAALMPADGTVSFAPLISAGEPFGIDGSRHDSMRAAMQAKWRGLQPAIRIEEKFLQLCRSEPQYCTAAGTRFLKVIEPARTKSGRALVGEINRAVNLAIRPMSDLAQYHVPDVWATPLTMFASGAGDCEDYAIAKYVALREAGVAAADLRLVILRNPMLHEDHAVTAARVDGQWLILDNRTMLLLTDDQIGTMTPLVSLDDSDGHETSDVAQAS